MEPPRPSQDNGLSPTQTFTPREYDSALVHLTRAKSLEAITFARLSPDGQLVAWEGVIGFAESLIPQASETFLRNYLTLRRRKNKTGVTPIRELWRICSIEMREQGRLGDDKAPVDVEKFGIE